MMARKIGKVRVPVFPKRHQKSPVNDAERLCERERQAVLEKFVAPINALDLDAICARAATHARFVSMVEYRSSHGTEWRMAEVKP